MNINSMINGATGKKLDIFHVIIAADSSTTTTTGSSYGIIQGTSDDKGEIMDYSYILDSTQPLHLFSDDYTLPSILYWIDTAPTTSDEDDIYNLLLFDGSTERYQTAENAPNLIVYACDDYANFVDGTRLQAENDENYGVVWRGDALFKKLYFRGDISYFLMVGCR